MTVGKKRCNHLYSSSTPKTPCLLCGKPLVEVLEKPDCKCDECEYWRGIYELDLAKKPFLLQRTLSFRVLEPLD